MRQISLRKWLFWTLITPIFVFMIVGFFAGSYFIKRSIDSWFKPTVRSAIKESYEVALSYREAKQETLKNILIALNLSITRIFQKEISIVAFKVSLEKFLTSFMKECNLCEIGLYNTKGQMFARIITDNEMPKTENMFPTWMFKFFEGYPHVISPNKEEMVGIIKLENAFTNENDLFIIIRKKIEPTIQKRIFETKKAAREYENNLIDHTKLGTKFKVIFCSLIISITLLIFLIIIRLSNKIILPIIQLAKGAKNVEKDLKANFDIQYGIYELKVLGQTFSKMISKIKHQKNLLQESNTELKQKQKLLSNILKGVSSGVIFTDKDDKIIFFNEKAVALIPDLENSFEIPKNFPCRKQCEEKTIFFNAIEDKNGKIITFDDISPLINSEKQKAFQDITQKIAHEIKNPLTPIRLSAEAIASSNDPKIKTYSSIMLRNVDQIYNLISSFATLSNLPKPIKEKIQLNALLREIKEEFSLTFPNIEFSLSAEEIIIYADQKLLYQAISNVIYNAAHVLEGKKDGKIGIKLYKEEKINLIIEDNGPNWPEGKELNEWLEPYKTIKKQKGSGLGLTIVKKIMDDHNGETVLERGRIGAVVRLIL